MRIPHTALISLLLAFFVVSKTKAEIIQHFIGRPRHALAPPRQYTWAELLEGDGTAGQQHENQPPQPHQNAQVAEITPKDDPFERIGRHPPSRQYTWAELLEGDGPAGQHQLSPSKQRRRQKRIFFEYWLRIFAIRTI
jgi:hypothetical protein